MPSFQVNQPDSGIRKTSFALEHDRRVVEQHQGHTMVSHADGAWPHAHRARGRQGEAPGSVVEPHDGAQNRGKQGAHT